MLNHLCASIRSQTTPWLPVEKATPSVKRRFAAAFVFGETFGDERFRLNALDNLAAAPFDTGKLHFHSPVGPVPMPDGQDLEIHGQYIVNAALFLYFIF